MLVLPKTTGRAPAVILLHGSEGGTGNGGLGPIAQTFAQRGFVALVLCYFECPGTPATLTNIPVETVTQAVDYLQQRTDVNPKAIGVVGYSRGAELALITTVLDPRVHAVASVLGTQVVVPGLPNGGTAWLYQGQPLSFGLIPVERANGPVLLLHGERDAVWPVTNSYHLADRLAAHKHPYELVVYPRFGHTLVKSTDAIERTIAFFTRSLR